VVKRTLDELADDLARRLRQKPPERPPVVLLGAGASVESGIAAMSQLFAFLRCKDFDEFCAFVGPLTPAERYRYLSEYLQAQVPAAVTAGYRGLAALLADAYFDLVLSTNLDPLLEDALAAARLWRRDYLMLVNGVIRPDRLGELLAAPSPRVKVLRLHGDLFHRQMAWTPAEMDAYLDEILPTLRPVVQGRDVLVVGHSLRDRRIRELALGTGGAIWYTNPGVVPAEVNGHPHLRALTGPQATFETLFTGLAERLRVVPGPSGASGTSSRAATTRAATPAAAARPAPPADGAGAQTVDDLMASVVGLARGDEDPVCTGFVLTDPRVIVTDGFAAAYFEDGAVVVVTAAGRRFASSIVRRGKQARFGAVLVKAPAGLAAPGLRVDARAPAPAMPVRVAVAAGRGIGLSRGAVARGKQRPVFINPVGLVDGLVALDCPVAPGSSGAPVTDDSFAVRGFIVAGQEQGASYMQPAAQWGALVAGRAGRPPARAPGRSTGQRARSGR
jgi:hypothetical protein